MHYFHVALEEFFAGELGIEYHVVVETHRIGLPTVHLETDFSRPFSYGTISKWKYPCLRSAAAPLLLITGYLKKARENPGLWDIM